MKQKILIVGLSFAMILSVIAMIGNATTTNVAEKFNGVGAPSEISPNIIKYGWVYGKVLLKSGDTVYPGKNVTVYFYQTNKNTISQSSQSKEYATNTNQNHPVYLRVSSVLTNKEGEYNISNLKIGTYVVQATKNGLFTSSQKSIEIKEDAGTEANFIIEISVTRAKVDKSITAGTIGGEISIQRENGSKYQPEVTIYKGVEIKPVEVVQGKVSLIVSGDEHGGGKTIAITVDPSLFENAKDIVVKYDGEPISMADNITDVLNPNDDGSHAEYLITFGANATEILISIPHFSEHEITIYSVAGAVVNTFGGVNAVLTYVAICAVAAVLFVGTIYIRRRF